MTSKTKTLLPSNKLGNKAQTLVLGNEFISQFIADAAYRTKIVLYAALSANLLYSILKLAAGIYYASFWFGADALFYIVLSATQFSLLRHLRKGESSLESELRQYRFSGYFLFALAIALTGVVYQVVNQGAGYTYPGLLIYIVATYAFACLTLAIINVVTYRKLNSPVLSAIKVISLSKALVAIFALTASMLTAFGEGDSESFSFLINSLTGTGVCLFILGMAVMMIINANKNLRLLKEKKLLTFRANSYK